MFPNKDQRQHPSPYDDGASTGPYLPSASAYPSRPEYQEGFDPRLSGTMTHMANMTTPADMYRMPVPEVYPAGSPDGYRGPPSHVAFNQPAPRQRTAIACRYCRRRKIRCSGFESSEDGRCTNCQRFNQECIFTPVSSQAQAFVPAHAAYPHLRTASLTGRGRPVYPQSAPPIYGAHGQPLNVAGPMAVPYGPDTAAYAHPTTPVSYGLSPPEGATDPLGRKRGPDELSHTSALPPSMSVGRLTTRRGSSDYPHRDQVGQLPPGSPASSTASYQASYYSDARRTPPPPPSQASYSYERNSSSPQDSVSTPSSGFPFPGLHSTQALPAHLHGSGTPPPPLQRAVPDDARRSGISIQNLLDPGQGPGQAGRSATDHEMLDALMPRRGK